jgi:hypothetical protein
LILIFHIDMARDATEDQERRDEVVDRHVFREKHEAEAQSDKFSASAMTINL